MGVTHGQKQNKEDVFGRNQFMRRTYSFIECTKKKKMSKM